MFGIPKNSHPEPPLSGGINRRILQTFVKLRMFIIKGYVAHSVWPKITRRIRGHSESIHPFAYTGTEDTRLKTGGLSKVQGRIVPIIIPKKISYETQFYSVYGV